MSFAVNTAEEKQNILRERGRGDNVLSRIKSECVGDPASLGCFFKPLCLD